MEPQKYDLINAAEKYISLGLSVLPTNDRKEPAVNVWTPFQSRKMSSDEIPVLFNQWNVRGIGIIGGDISGGLEILDIDTKHDPMAKLWEDFKDSLANAVPGLMERFVIAETRNNGYHLYYRCRVVQGNTKLAKRTNQEVLIETRGQGGYVAAYPSEGYSFIQGDLSNIPEITKQEREALFSVAKCFNELYEHRLPEDTGAKISASNGNGSFEDYNQRGDVVALLEKHGWKIVSERDKRILMLRPGPTDSKSSGNFHTEKRLFRCFSSSTNFDPDKAYNPTGVYTVLECDGDKSRASRQLYNEGFGERYNSREVPKAEPGNAESPLDKFKRSLLDQSKDYPLPEPVINLVQNGETYPLLTLKSSSLWQGKGKAKKTTALAMVAASFISPTVSTDPVRFERGVTGKVLFCDCEQGLAYAARTMKLVLKLINLQGSEDMFYSDLREFTPTERLEIIEAGIQYDPEIRLVIIDGLVDVMIDFMEPKEGQDLITKIGTWSSKYNLHIAGILHQNKADKNARAHVGSIAGQKAEIEIMTERDIKNPSMTIITAPLTRGYAMEPFAIQWLKGSLPSIVQDWSHGNEENAKAEREQARAEMIAKKVFAPLVSLKTVEAIREIMKETRCKESTAKKRLKEMKDTYDLIEKGADGRYRSK